MGFLYFLSCFLLIPLSVLGQEIPFPASLTPETYLYRGQSTQHASLEAIVAGLLVPNRIVAKSRLYRTFEKKLGPGASDEQISRKIEDYVDYLRTHNLFYRIRHCHVDVWDCPLPALQEFLGDTFSSTDLPPDYDVATDLQQADRYLKANILTFFDPFISLSTDLNQARFFAGKSGSSGYVLYVHDIHARNCSLENMAAVRCLINHEEYLEELEYPFIGFIWSHELAGLETSAFILKREQRGFELIDRHKGKTYRLVGDKTSCRTRAKKLKSHKFLPNAVKSVLENNGFKYTCKT